MSCGIALSIALMASNPAVALAAEQPPAVAGAPVSVAGEPLFADIIARAASRNVWCGPTVRTTLLMPSRTSTRRSSCCS